VSTQKPIPFKSAAAVFVSYLFIRAAPLTALIYYFSDAYYAFFSAFLLGSLILLYALRHNHHFLMHQKQLVVSSIGLIGQKKWYFEYDKITAVYYKLSDDNDSRQWLCIEIKKNSRLFRCDWLHRQDPPETEDDQHQHPEGELFELLEDEDFYKGSIEQLLDLLRAKNIELIQQ
jgi:hypothetical protein